jgi:hypothetical protein
LSQRGSRDDVSIAGIFNKEDGKKFINKKRKAEILLAKIKEKQELKQSKIHENYRYFLGSPRK